MQQSAENDQADEALKRLELFHYFSNKINDNDKFLSGSIEQDNNDLFLTLPIEVIYIILTMMAVRDISSFGRTARYYYDLTRNQFFLESLFKRDFAFRYPVLSLFKRQGVHISWRDEYETAAENPTWPFPLHNESENKNLSLELDKAISEQNAKKIIELLRQGVTVLSKHLVACIEKEIVYNCEPVIKIV